MNLRTVLRFFRPGRTLLMLMIYPSSLSGLLHAHLGDQSHLAGPIILATLVPWLLGLSLSNVTHEPLHRPFAMVIPGLRLALRRVAFAGAFLIAVICALVAWCVYPAASGYGVLGVSAFCAAVPQFDRHLSAGGISGITTAMLAGAAAMFLLTDALLFVLQDRTGLVALAGLLLAAGSIVWGLNRRWARQRSDVPYTPIMAFELDRSFVATMARQRQTYLTGLGKADAPGVDWAPPASAAPDQVCRHAIQHATFGRWAKPRRWLYGIAATVIALVTLAGVPVLVGATKGELTVAWFLGYAASLIPSTGDGSLPYGALAVLGVYTTWMVTLLASGYSRPVIALPMSRRATGLAMQHSACRQLCVSVLWVIGILCGVTLVAQGLVSDMRLREALQSWGTFALLAFVVSCLVLCVGTVRFGWKRLFASGAAILFLTFSGAAFPLLVTHVMNVHSLVCLCGAAACACLLYLRRVRGYYAREDFLEAPEGLLAWLPTVGVAR